MTLRSLFLLHNKKFIILHRPRKVLVCEAQQQQTYYPRFFFYFTNINIKKESKKESMQLFIQPVQQFRYHS
ncbi:unnamed protein product [Ixodes pacificus]